MRPFYSKGKDNEDFDNLTSNEYLLVCSWKRGLEDLIYKGYNVIDVWLDLIILEKPCLQLCIIQQLSNYIMVQCALSLPPGQT